ncbi:maleylpyruvate isomerase family mycothiol-dependent enzyme [Pseudonocardia sp. H11422]|uniref:maleylpyruvate isomerase family mycothiol-dependent enzyme n=1 Tax=Pseudonocardia sp. H11422 TaxID=2835866 RepID=UPI0027E27D29|nr:maleylpyruvate isomerase family mycothiol-dependent enzyme [Pseudonocardia sp. H11422]
MTRTLADTLAWAGDGAAHLRGLMVRLGDDAFAAPSALPGWSRAHVLTHIARNADGMINLLNWARTGVATPAYASREQRDVDIEAGAARAPAAIRADVEKTSDRLAQVVKAMPESAWSATVRNVQGAEIAAHDIPWLRAREMWIHAVDLDAGASFTDLPAPMVRELLSDVTAALGAKEGCPAVRLIATDHQQTWSLGPSSGAVSVLGTGADLLAWVLGRTQGRPSRQLRTDDGRPLPELPAWL